MVVTPPPPRMLFRGLSARAVSCATVHQGWLVDTRAAKRGKILCALFSGLDFFFLVEYVRKEECTGCSTAHMHDFHGVVLTPGCVLLLLGRGNCL